MEYGENEDYLGICSAKGCMQDDGVRGDSSSFVVDGGDVRLSGDIAVPGGHVALGGGDRGGDTVAGPRACATGASALPGGGQWLLPGSTPPHDVQVTPPSG